ncbi:MULTISPECIES: LLM class flavin-dependent oxidoreductase [unclassified Variovorax]|uniref:LLM class flavin-dependent oxidoreductase n=1 Tax=unclassified Variovorax TaxID=663243 RepID=UPI00076C57FB|nr:MULTISPECIES: LLM class flavin-dependent oxidoreductase [unclassified Variovorax]KWT97949.1 methylene tetrahydromethanopterin reductase [Variovorax sp. WDL1]PNG59212.1 Pyrimidine monooxygenase RutA [Variovorax sp. B4]PNG60997.1 Pyrimidine monooxygenase RutA [Variovorax sp. B2]VTV13066.1 Pyrimidine monooxygenase RutA [Variovorax sp. WDL1]
MIQNPLFNSNKLKLGIFGTNGKGGAQTLVPEAYKPTWENAVHTAQFADRAGFEAIVAYARWKGYMRGRPEHASGIVLDPFTFSAGISQVTSYSTVFATSHAPSFHPLAVAKQCATIDIMSKGRFALNVVGGWNKPELEMFGAPLKEHDKRYDHLEEWLKIVKKLWAEVEEFDFEGDFYQVKEGMSMPKPLQQSPSIPIMSAGGSPRGRRFACEHADMCFVMLRSDDLASCKKQIDEYKDYAMTEFGRKVQVWTYAPVVQRETRKAAEDYLRYFAVDKADNESVDAWTAGLREQTQIMSKEELLEFRTRFAAGAGGSILLGTADDIANTLEMYSEAGLDGALLTWVDFADGINRFTGDVLPMLERRNLRRPFDAASRPGA